jgi:hypothetical protein
LHTAQVQFGATEQQPTHNIPIEILVAQQTQHTSSPAAVLACKYATAEICKVPLLALHALTNLLGPLLAFRKIRSNILPMT